MQDVLAVMQAYCWGGTDSFWQESSHYYLLTLNTDGHKGAASLLASQRSPILNRQWFANPGSPPSWFLMIIQALENQIWGVVSGGRTLFSYFNIQKCKG